MLRSGGRPRAGTVLRGALVLLAAYGFWVFLQPAVKAGIVNVGNVAGMTAAVLLAVVALAWPQVARFVAARWATRGGRIGLGAVSVVVSLGLVWCGVLSARMMSAIREYPGQPATLVVLGCKVEGDRPGVALLRRVDTAADYLLANPSVQVVVSGGQGPDELISEAEAMRRALLDRGIAEDRIMLEDRSTSTLENLENTKELLAQRGLGDEVIVVTEGYHMHRALGVAERVGLDAEGLAAPSAAWALPTSWVREWFSLTLYELRG